MPPLRFELYRQQAGNVRYMQSRVGAYAQRHTPRRRLRPRRGNKALATCLLDHESSVEVGYGFYAIRSKLLIANDMYW